MTDLIEDWKKRKAGIGKKHKRFVRKLSAHKSKQLNKFADSLHDQVFAKIDCLACANCCTSIPPIVNKTDVARISKHLSIKPADFETQYLVVDEDHDTVMNQSPCPFLGEDNACAIYEVRPKACREYPHTNNHIRLKNTLFFL